MKSNPEAVLLPGPTPYLGSLWSSAGGENRRTTLSEMQVFPMEQTQKWLGEFSYCKGFFPKWDL